MLRVKSLERSSQWQSLFFDVHRIIELTIEELLHSLKAMRSSLGSVCFQGDKNDLWKKTGKEGLSKIWER